MTTLAERIDVWMARRGIDRVRRRALPPGYGWFADGDGLIRYRVAGSGGRTIALATDPPVVLEQYDELLDALAPHYRVLVFELPGFGYSIPARRCDFDFDAMNARVAHFLRALAMGPYQLCMPCVAGLGAAAIAASAPDLIERLIVVQTATLPAMLAWKQARDPRGILQRPLLGQLMLRAIRRRRSPQWLALAVADRNTRNTMSDRVDAAFAGGACFCLASAYQRYLRPGIAVPSIAVPALSIWGAADRSHAATHNAAVRDFAPGAQHAQFAAAGHFPELERPADFAAVVRAFAH